MTKIVQQVGGDKSNQDSYTGPERELTVDTDNWDLRLHDGVTPGGRPIISRDNADARYQGKSGELDGFSFAATLRGFVARLSPGDYRVRSIQGTAGEITVMYGDGHDNNPTISLPATITSDQTWTGQHSFHDVVEFLAGINANVSGNTNGTHTGPVVGNVTGNVTGDLNGNSTGAHTGDVDVRGHTIQFDANQIPTAAIYQLADFIARYAVPNGVIYAWSGSIADIPQYHYLCNGLNGTPDLRDKFVIGAGSTYDPGATTGSATHAHGITVNNAGDHTHGVTVDGHALTQNELPAHQHRLANGLTGAPYGTLTSTPDGSLNAGGAGGSSGASYFLGGSDGVDAAYGLSGPVGLGVAHSHTGSTASAGTHNHTATSGDASSLPPSYALCYIMKHA